MKLEKLLESSGVKADGAGRDALAAPVDGIAYDSKKVGKNFLFFAVRGARVNGEDFALEAASKGASAVVSGRALNTPLANIVVKDVKTAMARIAETFYGNPSGKLDVFAVTGTNGKTTVTYMMDKIAQAAGFKSAVFGTISYRWEGVDVKLPNTTAESVDLSRYLCEFLSSGGGRVAAEISSQGLDRKCADALKFRCAVFTNLTHEHLDWHKNVENYAKAKRRLFELLADNHRAEPLAVVNADDPASAEVVKGLPLKVVTFGIKNKADYNAQILTSGLDGSSFNVRSESVNEKILINLPGEFNVSNALASFAAAFESGTKAEFIKAGLAALQTVPGRMAKIVSPRGYAVYIDYAHTPTALKNALEALRGYCEGRLISVFGAGGDRDRLKRPEMGEVSARLADFTWITSDNPRGENPASIALDVEVGFRKIRDSNFKVVLDREDAVKNALAMAEKGDIVLIAGKGHEVYQIVGDKRIPYSDTEVVNKYI